MRFSSANTGISPTLSNNTRILFLAAFALKISVVFCKLAVKSKRVFSIRSFPFSIAAQSTKSLIRCSICPIDSSINIIFFRWSSSGLSFFLSISKLILSVINELDKSCETMEKNLDFMLFNRSKSALRIFNWASNSLLLCSRKNLSKARLIVRFK